MSRSGVLVRWSLPHLEHVALIRISRARGTGDDYGELVGLSLATWVDEGRPALQPSPAPVQLDETSTLVYDVVRWWLRRPPAAEILAPAKLAEEARNQFLAGAFDESRETQYQLQRIFLDAAHPARMDAVAELRKLLGQQRDFVPEGPMRTKFDEHQQLFEQLVAQHVLPQKGGSA